jgi:alpha-L-fucosidase
MRLRCPFVLLILAVLLVGCATKPREVPYWLEDYSDVYRGSPIEASRMWFKEARMGMFVHYNAASVLEHGSLDYKLWRDGKADERILAHVGISREAYEAAADKEALLFTKFKAENFDADKICQLAVKAKMKYVTFTAHHFNCLFDSKVFTVNSIHSPSGRDLVAEMVTACKKYNLAPFLYLNPNYPDPASKGREQYLAAIEEVLTNYGDIAGIWFDGDRGKDETNHFIKERQPHCLVSFKLGKYGRTEDYLSPEFFFFPFEYQMQTEGQEVRFKARRNRWETQEKHMWEECNQYKLREVCNTMQNAKWRDWDTECLGWITDQEAKYISGEDAYFWLSYSRYCGANLLMSIAPRADGSIHPEEEQGLIELARIIDSRGWPPVVHPIPAIDEE